MRARGGNTKFRAMRLDTGTYSWGSESISRKARIVSVVYNASNNELVRTNTLVKSAIVQIDATPFRQWYENHYGQALGRKKATDEDITNVKRSNHAQRKVDARKESSVLDIHIQDQFNTGRLYGKFLFSTGFSIKFL